MAAGGAIPPAAGGPLRGTARSPRHGTARSPRHGAHGTARSPRHGAPASAAGKSREVAGRARVQVPPRTHHGDGGHHVGGGARPAAGGAAGAGTAVLPCRPPACRGAFLGRADVSGGGAPRPRLGAAPARPPGGRAGAGSPLRAPPFGPGAGPSPVLALRGRTGATLPVLPLPSPCPRGCPAPSRTQRPPVSPTTLAPAALEAAELPAPDGAGRGKEQRYRAGHSGSGCLG